MQVVIDELERAATTMTEAEIARAKAQMKAGLLMALESSSARAEQLARQIMIYGRPLPLPEIMMWRAILGARTRTLQRHQQGRLHLRLGAGDRLR